MKNKMPLASDPMIAWDKTWRMHHIPKWVEKAIRRVELKAKNWNPDWGVARALNHRLFDHYGSVKRGSELAFITQPYHNHDIEAKEFAAKYRFTVISLTPGPWSEGTWLYEFRPIDE